MAVGFKIILKFGSRSFIARAGRLASGQLLPYFFGRAGSCLWVTDPNSHAGITTSW